MWVLRSTVGFRLLNYGDRSQTTNSKSSTAEITERKIANAREVDPLPSLRSPCSLWFKVWSFRTPPEMLPTYQHRPQRVATALAHQPPDTLLPIAVVAELIAP